MPWHLRLEARGDVLDRRFLHHSRLVHHRAIRFKTESSRSYSRGIV